MDDVSLDEFLDDAGGADDGTATGTDDTGDGGAATDTSDASPPGDEETPTADDGERVDPATVDPAVVTSRWDAGGVVCVSCGEGAERCWESPDGMVCPACKEWS